MTLMQKIDLILIIILSSILLWYAIGCAVILFVINDERMTNWVDNAPTGVDFLLIMCWPFFLVSHIVNKMRGV